MMEREEKLNKKNFRHNSILQKIDYDHFMDKNRHGKFTTQKLDINTLNNHIIDEHPKSKSSVHLIPNITTSFLHKYSSQQVLEVRFFSKTIWFVHEMHQFLDWTGLDKGEKSKTEPKEKQGALNHNTFKIKLNRFI